MSEPLTPSTAPEGTFNADLRGVHYDFLKDRVPTWFTESLPQRQEELANHELVLPAWYVDASAQKRTALAEQHLKYRQTLNRIEEKLGGIHDISEFAETRLKAAIKQQFNLELDVKRNYVARKYGRKQRGDLGGFFVFEQRDDAVNYYEYRATSLLQAALANFEPSEEKPLPCNDCHVLTAWDAWDSDLIPDFRLINQSALPISPHEFARLCRELDLGKQYREHLQAILTPTSRLAQGVLEQQLQAHHRQQLALAIEIAHSQFLKNKDQGISTGMYTALQQVVNGKSGITLDGKPLTFAALKVFDTTLVGPLLIGPSRENSDRVERLVVYLPGDAQQPLKEYASSSAFMVDLRARLHCINYRRFFSRFIPTRDQGAFFQHFNRLYQPASGATAKSDYPLQPRPAGLPMEDTALNTASLWEDECQRHISRIFDDARVLAVSTEDENREARIERLEGFKDAVVSVFNLAAFVVPGLGPIMLAVGAAQMFDDAFEGIEAYEEGDTREMWAHFSSVALNAAFIATGSKVLPAVKLSSMVDNLRPVTLPSGKQQLWNPDISSYKLSTEPAADATPDAQGLYAHQGHKVLPLEGEHYRVGYDADADEYQIEHPTRPDAYSPQLEHNNEGAWHHEGEEPLTWDGPTLMRRMGLPDEPYLAQISGVDADVLRETFVENDPVPLLLRDTIQRLEIHRQLTSFVQQLQSAHAEDYAQADPALQLHIMQRRGLLPADVSLRVVEGESRVLWESAPSSTVSRNLTTIVSTQSMADRGLLVDVLRTLQLVDPALQEIPGETTDSLAARAGKLRAYIADEVDSMKMTLVNERYSKLNTSNDSNVRRVLNAYPDVPAGVIARLLDGASAEELLTLSDTGKLPEALAEEAQWFEQEVRVSRAYEGLYADTLNNIDSQRLALHTLELLPGWPRDTRVELRNYSATGPVLDAIGASDASNTRTLVLLDNGQFEGPSPNDFYTATWELLSPQERVSLGLDSPRQLAAAIKRMPLPRVPLRSVLQEYPIRKPAYDPAMRLLGGAPGIRQLMSSAAEVFRSPQARVRKLFPSFTDAQVSEFIESLGDDVRGGLDRWTAEYKTLKKTLKAWVKANTEPPTESTAQHSLGWAERTARRILDCWRRKEGISLELPARLKNLPALTANFGHVEALDFYNVTWSDSADGFLKQFPNLKKLSIVTSGLTALPTISHLRNLTELNLSSNRIRLSAQDNAALGNLATLEKLNLAGNPLGTTPDFSTMSRLVELNLSNTQLTRWPVGLRDQPGLSLVDLQNNRLTEVPQATLNPPAEQLEVIARVNGVTLLDGNPFSEAYAEHFDRYWQRLGQEHPDLVEASRTDAFYFKSQRVITLRKLYPKKHDFRTIRAFLETLGDLPDVELARLEQEFDALETQLNAWSFSGGGSRERYVRTNARNINSVMRGDRYRAHKRILSCWRRETPQVFGSEETPIGLELDLSGLRLPSLPDLDADFSHVGSLKLSNISLSTSPEGFLARFRGVRWLDLSKNLLRELPPALGEMDGLTRLDLSENQIRLTPETARILSGRVTVRGWVLRDNPLGITPDFSQITDMRSLSMQRTGIVDWPNGLQDQPLLAQVELYDNEITIIPDAVIAPSDERLADTERVNNVTRVHGNPLSEETLQRVRAYSARLEQAGLSSSTATNRLVATALQARRPGPARAGAQAPFLRWTASMPQEQVASRRVQWSGLREQPGADGFFDMIAGLQHVDELHADLQQRVWEVLDSITENRAESEELRRQMFEWAGNRACCDRAELSFGNMEVMTMVYRAQAVEGVQGAVLLKLSRRIFRFDEVEKIALQEIARRKAQINARMDLTPAQKVRLIDDLEEVEIRLAYRYGLKERLDLPGPPRTGQFMHMGKVTQAMLDKAYEEVVALDNSPQEFQALVKRDFWQAFVTNKYRSQFEAQSHPYQERMDKLFEDVSADKLSDFAYKTLADGLLAELAEAESRLIETLTRDELAEHPTGSQPSGPDEPEEETTDL